MSHRNLFCFLKRSHSSCNIVNRVKEVCAVIAVISVPALVADSYHDILKNDESILMLERLSPDLFRANRPFAILALIAIHKL